MIIWTGGPDRRPAPRMTAGATARYWAQVALVGGMLYILAACPVVS